MCAARRDPISIELDGRTICTVVELDGGIARIEQYDVELRPGELGPVVELNVGRQRILLRPVDWRRVVDALGRILDLETN